MLQIDPFVFSYLQAALLLFANQYVDRYDDSRKGCEKVE